MSKKIVVYFKKFLTSASTTYVGVIFFQMEVSKRKLPMNGYL